MPRQNFRSKLLAIKLAVSSALIVSSGFALIVSHLQHRHFSYEFWHHLMIVIGPSSIIFFLISFLILLQHYRCPNCKKLWIYNKVESTLLEDNIITKHLLGRRLQLVSRKYLNEYRCPACNHYKLSNSINIILR